MKKSINSTAALNEFIMPHSNFELLKKGDPAALEKIHIRYSKSIFWVGKQLLRDEFVVENLVQDCFLKLWQHRDTIESPKHLFFFLRLVMKRECISYYTRPHNQFHRSVNRLEYYENYQDYLLKDDVLKDQEHLQEQQAQQQAFEQVENVLPLLAVKHQRLIQLCLKFGFQYKAIAQVMGSNTSDIYNEVQRAIEAIKKIIHQGGSLETEPKMADRLTFEGGITEEQSKVFQLRCEQQLTFVQIAEGLGQTPKQVHQAFSIAYQYLQQQHEQQLESA